MNSIEANLKKYNWTPLHTRILSHRIGDGTMNVHGRYVWVNKYADHFVELATKLNIKFWGPYKSDKWGTKQLVMHKNLLRTFGKVVDADPVKLVRNCQFLVQMIKKLPKEHQIQVLLAIIVDDGSCTNWRLNVLSDMNQAVSVEVLNLWNSLFPGTGKIAIYITKHGTPVYRIFANRDGIVQFKKDINKAVNEHGVLADLWWKQEAFDKRYNKATSDQAKKLLETMKLKDSRKKIIFNNLKRLDSITFRDAMRILNLSKDRTRLLFNELIQEKRIFVVRAGNKARYSLKPEDISFIYRKKIILDYIKENETITNSQVRKLFNLGDGQAYFILKKLKTNNILKQHKPSPQKTYYTL